MNSPERKTPLPSAEGYVSFLAYLSFIFCISRRITCECFRIVLRFERMTLSSVSDSEAYTFFSMSSTRALLEHPEVVVEREVLLVHFNLRLISCISRRGRCSEYFFGFEFNVLRTLHPSCSYFSIQSSANCLDIALVQLTFPSRKQGGASLND